MTRIDEIKRNGQVQMSADRARFLAGRDGRIFDRPVWLYGWGWDHSDTLRAFKKELIYRRRLDVGGMCFWLDHSKMRYEALLNCGTLGGWPYYLMVGWCAWTPKK